MNTVWQPAAVKRAAIVWQLALDLARGDVDHARRLLKTPLFDVAIDGYDALRPRPKQHRGFMFERQKEAA